MICLLTISLAAWTPITLANPIKPLNDPDNYINEQQYNELETIISKLSEDIKYDLKVYIINQIDSSFTIEHFMNDLTYYVYNQNSELDDNSIFIMFSILDRKMRIRTGKNPRSVLTDSLSVYYLDSLKPNLRDQKYFDAITDVLAKIHTKFTSPSWFESLYLFLSKKSQWILIFICFILYQMFFDGIDKPAEDKLKRIKEISEKSKSTKQFIETSCIICLDEFESVHLEERTETELLKELNEQTDKYTFKNSETNEYPPEESKISEEFPPEECKEDSELLKKEKRKEVFKATLECGHTFHSNCISDWMSKQNKCPICRDKIDKEDENTKPLAENLVTIQSHYHPSFSDLAFDYTMNSFTWRRIEKSSSSRKSSWGSGSGGGSSSW
jgi:uncharacterized membrane protein YgcG